MVNWKDRGYVPDSDEDDEGVDPFVGPVGERERSTEIRASPNPLNRLSGGILLRNQVNFPRGLNSTNNDAESQLVSVDHDAALPLARDDALSLSQQLLTPPADAIIQNAIGPAEILESGHGATLLDATASRLETELRKGLQTVKEVLEWHNVADDTDSPLSSLSSLPSSIQSSPGKPHSHHGQDLGLGNIQPEALRTAAAFHEQFATRRSLRARAPIQLHPYALEAAKYQQDWKSRGLKPIRDSHIALQAAQAPSAIGESQGTEAFPSSPLQASHRRNQPSDYFQAEDEDESQSPVRGVRSGRLQLPSFELGEELPDLSDLLKKDYSDNVTSLKGYGKNTRQELSTEGTTLDDDRVFDIPEDEAGPNSPLRTRRRTFYVPPSPPRSRGPISSPSTYVPQYSRLSTAGSPSFLPSPFLSSDRTKKKRHQTVSPEGSEAEAMGITDEESESPSLSVSEVNQHQGVRKFQRKIKGVLPASWLRLDREQQKSKFDKPRQPHSPTRTRAEKGVAQRLPSSTMPTTNLSGTHLTFDDLNGLASSENDSEWSTGAGFGEEDNIRQSSFVDDVIEDNTIDPMLPTRKRSQGHVEGRRSKKLQQQLPALWSNVDAKARPSQSGTLSRRVSNKSHKHPSGRAKERQNKRRKRKSPTTRVTVFDAPGFEEERVPRYLKIAARQTLDVPLTAGFQDTSKKFFRLATRRDTQDITVALRGWQSRRGSRYAVAARGPGALNLNRVPQPKPGPATPLMDTEMRDAHPELISLKRSTNQTLERIRDRQHRNQSTQATYSVANHAARSVLRECFKPRSKLRLRPTESMSPLASHPMSRSARELANSRLSLPRLVVKSTTTTTTNTSDSTFQGDSIVEPPVLPAAQRRPRKQRPLSLEQRQIMMIQTQDDTGTPAFDEAVLLTGEDVKHDMETAVVSCFTAINPGNEILSIGRATSGAGSSNDSVLCSTIASMANLNRLYEPSGNTTSLVMPKRAEPILAGLWIASISSHDMVDNLFNHIAKVILQDPTLLAHHSVESTTSDRSDFGDDRAHYSHALLVKDLLKSVDSIVKWLNSSIWFASSDDLVDFVLIVATNLERLTCAIQEKLELGIINLRVHCQTLPLLNFLVIMCYQLQKFAQFVNVDTKQLQSIRVSYDVLVNNALSLALHPTRIELLLGYLVGLSRLDYISTTDVSDELDAMLIAHQFSQADFWPKYLDGILLRTFGDINKHHGPSLTYTIVVIGCLHSIDIGRKSKGSDHETLAILSAADLVVLQNALCDYLKFFSDIESKSIQHKLELRQGNRLSELARFGSVAFRWTFLLLHAFGGQCADQLLKKLLKNYGDRNMQNFFSSGIDTLAPSFLTALVPASQIVLEPEDTDFHIFLKLVALTLGFQQADGNNHAAARKLASRKQSLIFSLLPNNVFQLNEEQSLTYQDLSGMANRYNLFSTMYHYAPAGSRPPLANIRLLIEFQNSHEAVCEQALKCWASLGRSLVVQGGSDEEYLALGEWISSMFLQILEKWQSIPVNHEGNSDEERLIHRTNSSTTSSHLCRILQTWIGMIEICVSERQARLFLLQLSLDQIMEHTPQHSHALPDTVFTQVFVIISTYLRKSPDASETNLIRDLQPSLQTLITNYYNARVQPKDEVLVAMTETWYLLAESMVNGKCAFWDNYINPASMSSFEQMGSSEISRNCCILFLSKAIGKQEFLATIDHFYLFEQWLTGLLRASEGIKFEHLLTIKLFEVAPETLDFALLRRQLQDNGVDVLRLTKDDLIKNRLFILRHIIRKIHALSLDNSTSNCGILSKVETLKLLKAIQRVMRKTWENLSGEAKAVYTMFIHNVIIEMTAYKIKGFEIDAFYSTPELLDQDDPGSAEWQLFTRQFVAGQDIMSSDNFSAATHNFRVSLETCCVNKSEKSFVSRGIKLFGAAYAAHLDDIASPLINTVQQLSFMQTVFPEALVSAFDDSAPEAIYALPITELTTIILKTVRERGDYGDCSAMELLARWIAMTLHAVFRILHRQHCDFAGVSVRQYVHVAHLLKLVIQAATAFSLLTGTYPQSQPINLLYEHSQNYIYWTYEYVCTACKIAYNPLDPILKELCPDPTERARFGFGLDMPSVESDPFADEEVENLRKIVHRSLQSGRRTNWSRVGFDHEGRPLWRHIRARVGVARGELAPYAFTLNQAKVLVEDEVEELRRIMVMLGLKQM